MSAVDVLQILSEERDKGSMTESKILGILARRGVDLWRQHDAVIRHLSDMGLIVCVVVANKRKREDARYVISAKGLQRLAKLGA